MKIVVIGGTGLIGWKLVANLRQRGHNAIAASPSSGVNSITGEGLADAMATSEVVVDVTNAPSWEDEAVMSFFGTSTRNLLAAEAAAGVRHHVALSVVGTDRLQESGYFRAKMAQETLIRNSKIPYTIVRATQFFEFLSAIAQHGTDRHTVRLSPALMQPIAAEDVAVALTDFVLARPLNGIAEVAGPEAMGIDEAVSRVLSSKGDPRQVVTDTGAGYYGMQVGERSLTPSKGARLLPTRLDDWLARAERLTAAHTPS